MVYKTEVAVIGASPAGLLAARNAALGGADVTLFDKKREIGVPSHPANSIYEGMMGITGEKIKKCYVRRKIKGMKIISPSGHEVKIDTPGYSIDKTKFDQYYAKRARKVGVKIESGKTVSNITKRGDKYFFKETDENGIAETVRCDLLILADGVFSNNSRKLGLKTMKYRNDIAWGTELEIKAKGIGKTRYGEYYVGSHAPGWKSSFLPLGGDNAAVGVYVRRHGKNLKPFLDNWIKRVEEIKGISYDMEIVSRKFAGDPIVTIPNKIVAEGLMVCGGAAGQSGIGYGMRAGQIAGNVAAKAIAVNDTSLRALSEYKKEWKSELWVEHVFGRIAFEAIRKMDDEELDEVLAIYEDEDITELIRGNTIKQGLSVMGVLLKKDPAAILKAGALLRNR